MFVTALWTYTADKVIDADAFFSKRGIFIEGPELERVRVIKDTFRQ
jgi:hypothetical protein